MKINPRLRTWFERVLPGFVRDRLDPFQAHIDAEVAGLAAAVSGTDVVLDAGAGEGRHRGMFTRGRYVGLDGASGDPDWDYGNLDVCGDLHRLPFGRERFDFILCMVVLEHTEAPRVVLEEFARVLKPGGELRLVVPFLWEEHQAPRDFFRFTRYGIRHLFEGLPFETAEVQPIGGFFQVCARRCLNMLAFFQGGWRWVLFVILAPALGLLLPLLLGELDRLDRTRSFTLGFAVRATRR